MRSLKAQLSESQKKLAVIHKYNDRLLSLAGREEQDDGDDMYDDCRVIGSQIDAMREEQRQRLDQQMYEEEEEDKEKILERQQSRRKAEKRGGGDKIEDIQDEEVARKDGKGFRQKKRTMNARNDDNGEEDGREYFQRNTQDNSRRMQAQREENISEQHQEDDRFRGGDREAQKQQQQQQQHKSRQKWNRNEEEADLQQNIKAQKDLRYQQQPQQQQMQQDSQVSDGYEHSQRGQQQQQRERKQPQRMHQELQREMEKQEYEEQKNSEDDEEEQQYYQYDKQPQVPQRYQDNISTAAKKHINMLNSHPNSTEPSKLADSKVNQLPSQDKRELERKQKNKDKYEDEERKYEREEINQPKPQKLKSQGEQKQPKYPSASSSKISNNSSSTSSKKINSSYPVMNASDPDSSIYVIVDNKKSLKKTKNSKIIDQSSKIDNYENQPVVYYPPIVSPFSQYIPDQRDIMNPQGFENRSKLMSRYSPREFIEDNRMESHSNIRKDHNNLTNPRDYYQSSRHPQEDQYVYQQGNNQNISRMPNQNNSQINTFPPYSRECQVKITEINETQEQVEEEEQPIVNVPVKKIGTSRHEDSMKESQEEEEEDNPGNRGSFDPNLNKNYFKYLQMREDIDRENGIINSGKQEDEKHEKQSQQQLLNPAKEMTSVSIQTSAWLKDSIKQTNEESSHLSEESPKPYVPFDPHLNKNYFKFLDMEEQMKKEKEPANGTWNNNNNSNNSYKRKYDNDQQVSFAGSKQDEFENEQRKMKNLLGEQEEQEQEAERRIQPREVGLGDINNSMSQNLRRNQEIPMVSQQKQQQQQTYAPQLTTPQSDDKQQKPKEINAYPMSQTLKQSFLMLSTKPAKHVTAVTTPQHQQQQLGNTSPLQYSNAQIVGSLQQINSQDPLQQSYYSGNNQPGKSKQQYNKQIEEVEQSNPKQLSKSKFQHKDNLVTSNAYATPLRSQQFLNRSELKESNASSIKDEYYYQDQEAIGLQPDQPFPIPNKQQQQNNLKINQTTPLRDKNNRIYQSSTPDKGISSVRSPSPNLAKLSKLQAQVS